MFPCHRSHSWISGGDHFLVKNPQVLASSIIENGRSWLFSRSLMAIFIKNGGCVAIDHRPDAHTPHPTYGSLPENTYLDFWCRPFLGQNLTPHMFPCHRLHSWISGGDHFLVKTSPRICFLAIYYILGFLVETISWLKTRTC